MVDCAWGDDMAELNEDRREEGPRRMPSIASLEVALAANPGAALSLAPSGEPTITEERPTIAELLAVTDGRYVLDCGNCSKVALETFNSFLKLVRHGAKAIDIHVRKDGQEYRFQADILKYIRKEQPPKGTGDGK